MRCFVGIECFIIHHTIKLLIEISPYAMDTYFIFLIFKFYCLHPLHTDYLGILCALDIALLITHILKVAFSPLHITPALSVSYFMPTNNHYIAPYTYIHLNSRDLVFTSALTNVHNKYTRFPYYIHIK